MPVHGPREHDDEGIIVAGRRRSRGGILVCSAVYVLHTHAMPASRVPASHVGINNVRTYNAELCVAFVYARGILASSRHY